MTHNGYRQRNARLYMGMKKEDLTGISASVRTARSPSEPVVGNDSASPRRRAMGFVRSAIPDSASIERQKSEIAAFAAREDFELTETLVCDGVAGNDDRPIEMILKRKSDGNPFDFLIITESTRLTRAGAFRGLQLLRQLEVAGIVVVTVNAGILASNARDPVITAFVKALSRKVCSRPIPQSYLTRRNLLPCPMPYGIDRLHRDRQTLEPLFILRYEDDGSRSLIHPKTSAVMVSLPAGSAAIRVTENQVTELVPGHPSKIKVIKFIFDCYTKLGRRWSLRKVAGHLNQIRPAGINGRPWTPAIVKSIVKNPAYLGYTIRCDNRNVLFWRNGVHRKMPRHFNCITTEHPKLKSAFMDLETSERLWLLMQAKFDSSEG